MADIGDVGLVLWPALILILTIVVAVLAERRSNGPHASPPQTWEEPSAQFDKLPPGRRKYTTAVDGAILRVEARHDPRTGVTFTRTSRV